MRRVGPASLPGLLRLVLLAGSATGLLLTRAFVVPQPLGRAQAARRLSPPVMSASSSGGAAGVVVKAGDVVRARWSLSNQQTGAEIGDQAAFDTGDVSLVVGMGGYMPALHEALLGMREGEDKTLQLSPSEAFGEYYAELAASGIPLQNAPEGLKLGDKVKLSNGLTARVVSLDGESFAIDCNHPLAGQPLQLAVAVQQVANADKAPFQRAHFAAGCFWGLELAFQRVPGVVGTRAGYTQGQQDAPTYSQVCSGVTGHAEAVDVVWDSSAVSFAQLLQVFWGRHDPTQLNRQGNDVGTQYRGGVYCFSDEQLAEVMRQRDQLQQEGAYEGRPIVTEIKRAATFWPAEDYHQQYLQKGGQTAKKNAPDKIRCYG